MRILRIGQMINLKNLKGKKYNSRKKNKNFKISKKSNIKILTINKINIKKNYLRKKKIKKKKIKKEKFTFNAKERHKKINNALKKVIFKMVIVIFTRINSLMEIQKKAIY